MITESQRFTANARFGTLTLAGFNLSVALNLAVNNKVLTAFLCLGGALIGWLAIAANQPPRPQPTSTEPRPEIPPSTELEKRLQVAIASCTLAIIAGGIIAWIL